MVYSESIDKLKAVLSAMHNMSHKREKLEKKLRFQLEREIRRLKKEGGSEAMHEENVAEKLAELQAKNAALEADVVKVGMIIMHFMYANNHNGVLFETFLTCSHGINSDDLLVYV